MRSAFALRMATFGNYELLCHSEVKGPLHQSRCYRADALAIATNADFTASGRVGQAAITALRLASNSSNPKPDPKGSSRFSVSVVLTWLTETGERFSKPMRQKRQASWQPPTCIFLKHRCGALRFSPTIYKSKVQQFMRTAHPALGSGRSGARSASAARKTSTREPVPLRQGCP